MNDLRLRPMTAADAPAYFDHMLRHFRESGKDGDPIFHPVVEFESWVKEEQVKKTAEALELPYPRIGWQRIWIAEDSSGRVLADCLLRSGFMEAAAHRCQYAIGVERPARGKGIGARLSALALDWARAQKGLVWVDLWVATHNAPAIALYKKLGFHVVKNVEDQFRVHGQSVDDTQMALRLRER